jgi:hypothetical protein
MIRTCSSGRSRRAPNPWWMMSHRAMRAVMKSSPLTLQSAISEMTRARLPFHRRVCDFSLLSEPGEELLQALVPVERGGRGTVSIRWTMTKAPTCFRESGGDATGACQQPLKTRRAVLLPTCTPGRSGRPSLQFPAFRQDRHGVYHASGVCLVDIPLFERYARMAGFLSEAKPQVEALNWGL